MRLHAQWIVGFVDGEGCFTVNLVKQDSMKLGYQVLYEFVVVQHCRDMQILHGLKSYFKCGTVARNHGDRYHFRVRDFDSITNVIIPFFDKHSLKTTKRVNFLKFKKICKIVTEKKHLTLEGLEKIREIMNTMNNREKQLLQENKTAI